MIVQRGTRWIAVVAVLTGSVAFATQIAPSPAAASPSAAELAAVTSEYVGGGTWTLSLTGDFLPDGRILVGEENGKISLVDPDTSQTTYKGQVPNVQNTGEDGMLDFVVAPDFATTREVFVYHVFDGTARPTITKFQLTAGDVMTNFSVVWQAPGPIDPNATHHLGGSLTVGPDNKLYLSIGDNFSEGGANPQTLDNVYGKVLRINRDGTVPSDNPFFATAAVKEIWAYGFRNPYRADWDLGSSPPRLWLADVGGNDGATAYEEINIAQAGKNYGWPNCEGPVSEPKLGNACTISGVTGPISYYSHTAGQGCCFNRAIIGGTVLRPPAVGSSPYPSSFNGTYVYSDYTQQGKFFWRSVTDPADSGETPTPKVFKDLANFALPVWLDQSPVDGMLYWIELGVPSGNGSVFRFRHPISSGGNRAPVITGEDANPRVGMAPLKVNFQGFATDPDGTPVTFSWDFGDGGTGTGATPSHTYTAPGVYYAKVAATSGGQTTRAVPMKISAGSPPVVNITSPNPTTFRFNAGQNIAITGSATESQTDNTPLTGSSLQWRILLNHDGNHTHQLATGTGTSINYFVPATGHGWEGSATTMRVVLTATNSQGVSSTKTINLVPNKRTIRIASAQASTVIVGGITHGLPFDIDTIVGFQHALEVPQTTCSTNLRATFSSWNDGQPRVRTYTVGTTGSSAAGVDVTLTALYNSSLTGCGFISVGNPIRVLDTRSGPSFRTFDFAHQGVGAIGTGGTYTLPIAGRSGGPVSLPNAAGINAVQLNVTAVNPAQAGHLSVYPCGQPRPNASTLQFSPGQTVANAAVVLLGTAGSVCVYASTSTHVVVDMGGYTEDATELSMLTAPRRAYDSRSGQSVFDNDPTQQATGRLAAGAFREITATRAGLGGPASPGTVLINVSAVKPSTNGFLTVWPCGETRPTASNVNYKAGRTHSGLVTARPGTGGKVCVYTSAATDVLADVSGSFLDLDLFVPLQRPQRLLDSRPGNPTSDGQQIGGGAKKVFTVNVARRVGIPAAARTVVLNIVAVAPPQSLFLTAYPMPANQTTCTGATVDVPGASTLNAQTAAPTANSTWIRLGSGQSVATNNGRVCIYSSVATNVVVDVAGFFVG